MTYIQKFDLNEKELYRVSQPKKSGIEVGYYTLEEVLYILSTKEEEHD